MKNSIFRTFLKLHFSALKSIFFYPEYWKTIFFALVCLKNQHGNKLDFLIKTRTNTFEKLDFSDVFETSLFWSKKYSFLSIILKGNLFLLGLEKSTHGKQFDFFDKNHGLHPLKICDFLHIF